MTALLFLGSLANETTNRIVSIAQGAKVSKEAFRQSFSNVNAT